MIESVPLIQNANDAQQINASIIAMKKASKELDEKILKLNNLNKELDKKIAVLDSGLAQEITDRENADSAEVTNRNIAITNAVNALDVASVGGSGKYISAISETNGKINATVSDLTSVIESGNNQPATSGGVADAISQISETNVIYDSTITDCNNAFEKGKTKTYWLNSDVANVPNSLNGWYIISQCNSNQISANNHITQIATVGSDVSTNEMYIRHAYLSGGTLTFSDWERLVKASEIRASNNDDYLIEITNTVTKYLGAGNTFIRKVNNMVYLQINGTYTGSPSTSTQLFMEDIPVKYRPRMIIEGFALLGYNSNQFVTTARGRITTDGKLYLQETAWDTNTAIRCSVIYFIN